MPGKSRLRDMVASISEIPIHATGNIILVAQIYAAPGNAEKLQEILSNIKKNADSDAEPDCLEYRPARSFVEEGVIKFAVWEVYKNREALATHIESKAFADLVAGIKDGLLDRPPIVEYLYEI